MYRISALLKNGDIKSYNGTKKEIDTWLLDIMETEEVKLYRIINKETKEVIETEEGTK